MNGTSDVSGEQAAVEDALDSWSAVTNIDFIEACNSGDADIRISWETGSHGDVAPFDGSTCLGGNTIAHAFIPGSSAINGDMHFDDDENWATSGAWACDNIDIETVALHELGHSLGLDHSSVSGATMEDVANSVDRTLANDDISGIQNLYGSRNNPITFGREIMCKNSTRNVSISCVPSQLDITWSVTSNLQITGGQGTEDVTIKATGSGTGEITATVSSGCDDVEFSIDFDIEDGIPDYTKLDVKDDMGNRTLVACSTTDGEATYSGSGSIYEYEWDIPYASNWYIDDVGSPFTPYETVEIDYNEDPSPSTEKIHVRAKNECGWSWWKETTWTVSDMCGARASNDSIKISEKELDPGDVSDEPLSLKLYPTTTANVINVKWISKHNNGQYGAKIYNGHGQLVKVYDNLNSSNMTLRVGDLPNGVYYCWIGAKSSYSIEKFVVMR